MAVAPFSYLQISPLFTHAQLILSFQGLATFFVLASDHLMPYIVDRLNRYYTDIVELVNDYLREDGE
ncbi:MAG: hypothetical protein DMF64_21945 [Acidobacteria bacterium]|nr:MAG: hypothetical protein DMF64_21945 [Acidobacteriota bacterium]